MIDKGQDQNSPPLQGRGRGWGLLVRRLDTLQGYARELRNAPTEPEQRLWQRLRASQLDGFKFRRQASIGGAIVDFLCPQKRLAVEIDGETHVDPVADARRDQRLGALGYRLVRFTNVDVMLNIEGVLEVLSATLRALPDRGDSPHPNPSPEGEGL